MRSGLPVVVAGLLLAGCTTWEPGTPTLVAPPDSAVVRSDSLVFVWNSVSLADCYDLEVATDRSFSDWLVVSARVYDTTFAPAETLGPRTYYWRVSARQGG